MKLEERLRHELHGASAALPVVGVDFDRVLKRGRMLRRRTMMVAAAGTAAVIALGIGGALVLTRSTDLAPPPPAPVGTPSETPSPDQKPSFDRVVPVLRAWLGAIQDGATRTRCGL